MQLIKEGVLTKNFENKLYRSIHAICNHSGAYAPPPFPKGQIIGIKWARTPPNMIM